MSLNSAKDDFEKELHKSGEPPVRKPAEQQPHSPATLAAGNTTPAAPLPPAAVEAAPAPAPAPEKQNV